MASFDTLPNEIVTHIFKTLPSIQAVHSLASTCQYFNDTYHGTQRLSILTHAADAQYGPLDDILQICTYNASQAAHIKRHVPMSDALLKDIIKMGKVAVKWEELYPLKKWKHDYGDRRLLSNHERYILRRAIYRLWLYTKAFHTRDHPRTTRSVPHVLAERAQLLHNFSTAELAEMLDAHHILRDTIANNVCPSNGKIRQKFQKRYPESNHQLLFNIHLNYPPPSSSFCAAPGDGWMDTRNMFAASSWHAKNPYQSHNRLQPSRYHEPGAEGWGDEVNHYYVVEDMLKLAPDQILFLKDNCPFKSTVEQWIKYTVGADWFINNGETFCETLWYVVGQRGGDVEAVKCAVEGYEMGVVVDEDFDCV